MDEYYCRTQFSEVSGGAAIVSVREREGRREGGRETQNDIERKVALAVRPSQLISFSKLQLYRFGF